MGPTAAGKTALACALAERFPLDLISVDSALVYRGLDIGAAKPDAATLARFPHRLIDIRDPAQAYSAAEFREDALREMQTISAAGRTPLLVGGTGLYFRALQFGLSALPAADDPVEARTIRSSGTRISRVACGLLATKLFRSRSAPIRPISRPETATAVSGGGSSETGNTSLKQIRLNLSGIRSPRVGAAPTSIVAM